MRNFTKSANIVTLAAPAGGVLSGAGVQVGSVFGIAAYDAAATVDVEVQRTGQFTIGKTGAQAWTQGVKIYWDNATKLATTTVSTNLFIGYAALAAGSADTTGEVILHGAG